MNIRGVVRWFRSKAYVAIHRLSNVGDFFLAGSGAAVSRDLVAGDYVYIGPGSIVYPGVRIGEFTMFGPDVKVMGEDHIFDTVGVPIIFSGRPKLPETNIGRDVWIGAGSFVKCGVTIGDGVIIGANSVVLKDIGPFSIVAGSPAKFIRMRFPSAADQERHIKALDCRSFDASYAGRIRS
jgi:acetyltransferase-like isoleucine patch superfamily enzyme